MSKDQAARIAEKIRAWWVGKGCVEPSAKLGEFAEKSIRRAINAAVRKERERCVHCACKEFGFVHHKTLDAIMKAINGGKR